LQAQAWPGNVRELSNVIQRAVLLGDGQRLQLGGLGRASPGAVTAAPALQMAADFTLPSYSNARAEALRSFEQQYLEAVMTAATGNVSRAARLAGKERRAMGKLLKRHGIDRGRFSYSF
jgi:DNA-binding NtrC family response regulator